MRYVLTLVLALSFGAVSLGSRADSAYDPSAPLPGAQETQYRELIKVLRCLVCQNESLADSDAPLAADLRRQVRDMVAAGKSNTEIKAYLTARYGDFVLYKPPLQPNTWLLWGGPFVLALGGLAALLGYLRRTRQPLSRVAVDEAALQRLIRQAEDEARKAEDPTR